QVLLATLLLSALGGGILGQRLHAAVHLVLLLSQTTSLIGRVGSLRVGPVGTRRLAKLLGKLPQLLGCLLTCLLRLRQGPRLLPVRQSLRSSRLLLALLGPLGVGALLLGQLASEVLQRPRCLLLLTLGLGGVVAVEGPLGLVHRLPRLLQPPLVLVGGQLRC